MRGMIQPTLLAEGNETTETFHQLTGQCLIARMFPKLHLIAMSM
jgi:hypothetical protein